MSCRPRKCTPGRAVASARNCGSKLPSPAMRRSAGRSASNWGMTSCSPLIDSSRPTKRKYGRSRRCGCRTGSSPPAGRNEPITFISRGNPNPAVIFGDRLAERDEFVDVADLAFEQAGGAPRLRWPPMNQRAAQAFARRAELAAVPPQHVRRTDEPVLVRGVELDCVAQPEDAGPADQRDVVEMDHVEVALEHPAQCRLAQQRPAGRVGEERRAEGPSAVQAMYGDPGWLGLGGRLGHSRRAKHAPGIGVVHDVHLDAAPRESMGEAAHVPAIAAEVERRIERRHQRHAQRRRSAVSRALPRMARSRAGRLGGNEANDGSGTARMLAQGWRGRGSESRPARGPAPSRFAGDLLVSAPAAYRTPPTLVPARVARPMIVSPFRHGAASNSGPAARAAWRNPA